MSIKDNELNKGPQSESIPFENESKSHDPNYDLLNREEDLNNIEELPDRGKVNLDTLYDDIKKDFIEKDLNSLISNVKNYHDNEELIKRILKDDKFIDVSKDNLNKSFVQDTIIDIIKGDKFTKDYKPDGKDDPYSDWYQPENNSEGKKQGDASVSKDGKASSKTFSQQGRDPYADWYDGPQQNKPGSSPKGESVSQVVANDKTKGR